MIAKIIFSQIPFCSTQVCVTNGDKIFQKFRQGMSKLGLIVELKTNDDMINEINRYITSTKCKLSTVHFNNFESYRTPSLGVQLPTYSISKLN